jgi:hypothetical protein
MKVKLRNREEFSKREFIDAMIISGERDYDVYAIVDFGKGPCYLTLDCNKVWWYEAKFFKIVDEKVPSYWVKIEYKRWYKLKNKDYDFSIPIKLFYGPKELVDDPTFLFDIDENLELAYHFLISFLKKHPNQA